MNISFYQAECGDAARIRYQGVDGKFHNVLIDSGFNRTFRHALVSEINSINNNNERIDLWVISHIHDDHIGGALSYIDAIRNERIKDNVDLWYYNPPRLQLLKGYEAISSAKSITQGDALADYLLSEGKHSASDISSDSPPIDLYGLKLMILSPNTAGIKALRAKYPAGKNNTFERDENDSISSAKSRKRSDYTIPVKQFDLTNTIEDNSVENGSSICFLSGYKETKVLWLADAWANVVIESLTRMGYSKENPIYCDWVKVAHHGSNGNNIMKLYEMIRCNNYLISSNGQNVHWLPDKGCIARILRNAYRDRRAHYKIYFTYDNDLLQSMFHVDGEKVFEEFNFSVVYNGESALRIDLAGG